MGERKFVIMEAWNDGLDIPKITESEFIKRIEKLVGYVNNEFDENPEPVKLTPIGIKGAIDILLHAATT